MSEVERFTASKNNISRHVKGQAIGTTDFVMVMASDYDAALAREAALREENKLLRHDVASYLETTAKVCELLGIDVDAAKNAEGKPSDVLLAHAQALQQRLTDAEKRNSALEEALKFYADGDHFLLADADAWDTCSGEPINFLHDESGTASVEDGSIAKAALKPVEA